MPSEEGRCPTCGFALPFGRKIEVRRDDFDPVEMAARNTKRAAALSVALARAAVAEDGMNMLHRIADERAKALIDAALAAKDKPCSSG